MAGMFYTLIEVAEKLGKSEDQVRQMVQDGQLREFRDGPKLLFKKDEVDAMAGDAGSMPDDTLGLTDDGLEGEGSTLGLANGDVVEAADAGDFSDEMDLELDASGLDLALGGSDIDIDLAASGTGGDLGDFSDDTDVVGQEPAAELQEQDETSDLDFSGEEQEPLMEAESIEEEPVFEAEAGADSGDLGFADSEAVGDDSFAFADTSEGMDFADSGENLGMTDDMQLGSDSDESGLGFDEDLDLGDFSDSEGTKAGEDGISVLDESDQGYSLTEDSLSETTEIRLEGDSELGAEPSLDEDVNLESFGSGSGLLDLSLQADDTSLGAVLDDIIPGAGGGDDAVGLDGGMDLAAEADNVLGGGAEEMAAEPISDSAASADSSSAGMPAVAAMAYAEPAPDASSNAFGAMLILPFVLCIFTTIIAMAGAKGVVPGLLSGTQGIIWYVVGGFAVVALIWMFVGIAAGGSGGGAKPKKAKVAKPAKEKKPKKAKAPKKPKKAKKK